MRAHFLTLSHSLSLSDSYQMAGACTMFNQAVCEPRPPLSLVIPPTFPPAAFALLFACRNIVIIPLAAARVTPAHSDATIYMYTPRVVRNSRALVRVAHASCHAQCMCAHCVWVCVCVKTFAYIYVVVKRLRAHVARAAIVHNKLHLGENAKSTFLSALSCIARTHAHTCERKVLLSI